MDDEKEGGWGWVGLEEDMEMVVREWEKKELENDQRIIERGMGNELDEKEGLRILQDTIRDSWGETAKESRRIGFQVFGRIPESDRRFRVIARYLESIEKNGLRPWLRPMIPGLQRRDGRQIAKYIIPGGFSAMCLSRDGIFAVTGRGRELWISDLRKQETETIATILTSDIIHVAISVDNVIACLSEIGEVEIWDMKTSIIVAQLGIIPFKPVTSENSMRLIDESNKLNFSEDGRSLMMKSTSCILNISLFDHDIHFQQLCIAKCSFISRIIKRSGRVDDTIFPSSVCMWKVTDNVDGDEKSGQMLTKSMKVSDNFSNANLDTDQGIMSYNVKKVIDLRGTRRWGPHLRRFDLSENARYVLLVTGGWFGIWDLKNDVFIWRLIDSYFIFSFPKISTNGRFVVMGTMDNLVRIWDTRHGGYNARPLQEGSTPVASVEFSEDCSQVAVGSSDASIQIWCTATASSVGIPMHSHGDTVTCFSFSDDGRYLRSGSFDGNMCCWDLHKHLVSETSKPWHGEQVTCVAFSKWGQYLASGSKDSLIRVWDTESNSVLRSIILGGTHNPLRCVMFRNDDRIIVSGSGDGTIRMWDVDNGSLIQESPRIHRSSVTCIDCTSKCEYIVSGSSSGTVSIWDTSNKSSSIFPLTEDYQPIMKVAINQTGSYIAVLIDEFKIQVYHTKSQKLINEQSLGNTEWIQDVVFSDVGPLVFIAAPNGILRIWNFENGTDLGSSLKLNNVHLSDRYAEWILNQTTCSDKEKDRVYYTCPQQLHLEMSLFLQRVGDVVEQLFLCNCGDGALPCKGALGTGSDRFTHLSVDKSSVYVDNNQLIDENTFGGSASAIAVHGRFTAHGFRDGMVLICRAERQVQDKNVR